MKLTTIIALIIWGAIALAAYKIYDWIICTRNDRRNRRNNGEAHKRNH